MFTYMYAVYRNGEFVKMVQAANHEAAIEKVAPAGDTAKWTAVCDD